MLVKDIKKVVSNSLWLLLDKLIKLLVAVIVNAWVARYLGVDSFGELTYIFTLVAFFQVISELGLNNIVVRELSGKYDNSTIMGTAFFLKFYSSIIIFLGILLLGYFTIHNKTSYLMLCIVSSSLIFNSLNVIDFWFQGKSANKKTIRVKVISYFLCGILKVLGIYNHFNIVYFSLIYSIEFLFVSIGLYICYKKYKEDEKWKFSKRMSILLLKDSWPFIISNLSVLVYMRIDQLMIKNMLGAKYLGIYASALPLSSALNFVPLLLSVSINPILSKYKNSNTKLYDITIRKILILFTQVGLAISILIYIIAPYAIEILYGSAYLEAIEVLRIHAFTNLFICMGVGQSLWILNENKSMLSIYRAAIGMIVCVCGNFLLMKDYGLNSVAFIALLAQFSSVVLSNIIFSRHILKLQIYSFFPFIKSIDHEENNKKTDI
ncbi:TPA: flippase [Providencia stuartii]